MNPAVLLDQTMNGADVVALGIVAVCATFAKWSLKRYERQRPTLPDEVWAWPARADRRPRPYDQAPRDVLRGA